MTQDGWGQDGPTLREIEQQGFEAIVQENKRLRRVKAILREALIEMGSAMRVGLSVDAGASWWHFVQGKLEEGERIEAEAEKVTEKAKEPV